MSATQSTNWQLTASHTSQWKLNWIRHQNCKWRWKPYNSWRVKKLQELTASHQRFGKMEDQHSAHCSNYHRITLLSIAGKILASVLLNCLVPTIAEENLPESPYCSRANRGTIDMVFSQRHIPETRLEQNEGLCVTSADLTKAFDTESRKGLWTILGKLGCPPKFLAMVMTYDVYIRFRTVAACST